MHFALYTLQAGINPRAGFASGRTTVGARQPSYMFDQPEARRAAGGVNQRAIFTRKQRVLLPEKLMQSRILCD
jgi:hypothetical protein